MSDGKEDSLDVHRRLDSLEVDAKDTNRILNSLTVTLEKMSMSILALHEVKDDQRALDHRVTETEKWIDQNRQSIANLPEDRKVVDKLKEQLIQQKPIVKALLYVTGVIVTAGIGMVLMYLFTGKIELPAR